MLSYIGVLNLLKICYFQRKHEKKRIFPLFIETILLYLHLL